MGFAATWPIIPKSCCGQCLAIQLLVVRPCPRPPLIKNLLVRLASLHRLLLKQIHVNLCNIRTKASQMPQHRFREFFWVWGRHVMVVLCRTKKVRHSARERRAGWNKIYEKHKS
jgi:hypothetical protein